MGSSNDSRNNGPESPQNSLPASIWVWMQTRGALRFACLWKSFFTTFYAVLLGERSRGHAVYCFKTRFNTVRKDYLSLSMCSKLKSLSWTSAKHEHFRCMALNQSKWEILKSKNYSEVRGWSFVPWALLVNALTKRICMHTTINF